MYQQNTIKHSDSPVKDFNSDTSSVISETSIEHNNNGIEIQKNKQHNWLIDNEDLDRNFLEEIKSYYNNNKPGPKLEYIEFLDETPIEFFKLFWDNNIINHIALQSTIYMKQICLKEESKKGKTKYYFIEKMNSTISYEDIEKYLLILLIMGFKQYPDQYDHWRTDAFYIDNIIPNVMNKDKFKVVKRALHCSDNENSDNLDPFTKIRYLIEFMNEKFIKHKSPERDLTIDEVLISYRGRVKFKFYIPTKPVRYGIKTHGLCESISGYCFKMYLDPGKSRGKQKNHIFNVVTELVKDFKTKYNVIFMDSWYSSPDIFIHLKNKLYGATGMVKINRNSLCKELVDKKIENDDVLKSSTSELCFVKMKDKKTKKNLSMISTVHNSKIIETKKGCKPEILFEYLTGNKGVDRMSQYVQCYQFKHSTKKWWKRIFYYVLEISILNSHILFKAFKNSSITFREFKESIIYGILQRYNFYITDKHSNISSKVNPMIEFVDIRELHNIILINKQRDCKNCSNRKLNLRKTTQYICEQCNVGLCPPCFHNYHIENIYPNI